MEFEFEKLQKAFAQLQNNQVEEKPYFHNLAIFVGGYYQCSENNKFYKRKTKTGFCFYCGRKIVSVK